MANTRSGGANNDGAADAGACAGPSTRKASAAAKAKDSSSAATSSSYATARDSSRSSSARDTSDTQQQQPNVRRSNRETRGKNPNLKGTASPASTPQRSTRGRSSGSTPETPESSVKKLKGEAGSTGKASTTRMSDRVKNASVSASTASNDSNGMSSPAATPHKTSKRQADEHNSVNNKHDATESGTRPSKKQKRLSAKSYTKLFRPSSEGKEKSPADEGNASKVHMEDNVSLLGYEESGGQEKDNQAGYTSGLCEASKVKLETHMTTDLCSQNNVAESSPAMEEPTDGYSNKKSFVPEPQSSPNSTIHSEEASKAIEERISIEIQEACTSKQAEVTQYDETDCKKHMCDVCRSTETPGILKSCDRNGCKRKYHLSCLGLPLECVSPGIWLCSICTKERLLSGVYSVSEGIESLWDVKEGVQNCKQYFVKHKNLAHVHNQWIPESDVIDSTPGGHNLISKFSKKIQKEKTIMWRQEWAEPCRLLKKRSLMPPREAEEFFHSVGNKLVFCNVEWLVKWKDLGYEHVTWELETSSFLCTPEAEELKRAYETRREAARKASDTAKINKVKQSPFQKLLKLPDGYPPGLDNVHLSSLNQLREFWHNSHGAIIVDDKERVIKTILFAVSILPDVCRPLLIVSTSASLALWEAKFNRLAPSINVVVYNGEKDVRKTIQDLEFYEKGSVMLQVLLSHPDAIIEDIETMKCIGWEAVIVDDCQSSRVLKCLEQLKCLHTDFRMVLLSSPLKENIVDLINLLSFLNSEGNDISSISNVDLSIDTPGTIAMLKSKLTLHVALEQKGDSSKFVEYWVPVCLSRVQLEIYCHTLLSNSPALQSHSKTDSVGALRDILVSLRKCCDHPYLVDGTLQVSLIKGHPVTDILDIGVHASGKLLLLDKMLREIRKKGLRVVILSQSGVGARNPMGDIFDDFVRQRFGFESYERVERGLHEKKKQSAMSMFNDKTKGRFIFLIDSRACVRSIKLSSVDVIIIYSSDWNPANDLRVLKKISIESQSEHVPVFRLYSSCTVEEKALILAKHEHTVDSNIQNISPILSHSLLSWGASFLFSRLEELKESSHLSKDSDAEKLFMDKVILEYLTKFSTEVDASAQMNNAAISQAHLCGPSYSSDSAVVGEREGMSAPDGDLPKFCAFWLNLLGGKFPRWQYITEPGQRCRRKIQNMEEGKMPDNGTDEASMKRRKIAETLDSSANVVAGRDKDSMSPEIKTTSSSQKIPVDDTWQEQGVENLQGTQKGLHGQLKPELSKLYKLLELPGNVICLCEELLEYTLKNHQVSQEPKGILHAFNIALCWRAASLLKHKVNRRESLTLAAKHLNYECNEDLAEFVYEKLRILKKKFSRRIGQTSKHFQSTSVKNISPNQLETSTKLGNDESILNQVAYVDGNVQNGSNQEDPHDLLIEAIIPREKELSSVPEFHEEHLSKDVLLNRITEKKINLVNMVFSLREKNIHDEQANEVAVFDMNRQKGVLKLREACKIVVEHLRRSQAGQDDRDAKIKLIVEWFTMLLYAFLEHIRYQREKLDLQQSAVWANELHLKRKFLQEAKLGQLDHTFDQDISLPDSGFVMEEFNHFSCCVDTATLANCPKSLDPTSAMEITLVRSVIPSEVINAGTARNGSAETFIQTERRQESEDDGLTENRINSSSDCIDSQGGKSLAVQDTSVQHTFISSPAIDSCINQDSSTGDHRSTEHVGGENDVGSQPLLGGTDHHLGDAEMEDTSNRDSTRADPPEPQTVAPVPGQASEQMSKEVETRTNIVMESTQSSIVPAQLLQREAEQVGLPGEAPAHILHLEMQPSLCREVDTQTDLIIQSAQQSMVPAQHLEVEQAALCHVPSAQALLSGMQPSVPASTILLERTRPDRSQQSNQPEDAPGSSAQLFSAASIMFNHPPVGDEPLKNELHRLRSYIDSLNKTHELKQSQLRTECNLEIEKVKQKYDLLLREQDSTHLQQRKTLDGLCGKVLLNQSLAEDFRAKFISSAAQGRAQSPPNHQIPQVPHQVPTRPSAVASTASQTASSSAGRPPVPIRHVQQFQVDRPSPSAPQVSRSSSPSSQALRPRPLPSNIVRSTSVPFSHTPVLPRGGFGAQSELARAPAPHLQRRLRPQVHSMAPSNQQPLPTRLEGSTSARVQSIPVTPVNIRQSSPSSSHPSSNPTVPAPLGPSSSHQVPSSSRSTRLPSPVSSVPNPAPQLTSPPGFTRVSNVSSATSAVLPSRKVGPSASGTPQSDSNSVSLDDWLTGTLGLSGDPQGSAAPKDVVCLSDDE